MTEEVKDLKREAVQKAKGGNFDDMEHAASVCKLLAEAEKNIAEASTHKSALHQETLKSWAQILVPLISVLTLGITLYTQVQQQRAAQEAQEDSAWRAAIVGFGNPNQTVVQGLLAQVSLKPFMKSPRHSKEANELAMLILPSVAAPEAFHDLFDAIEWHDLNEMARVSRGVKQHRDEMDEELEKLGGSDGPKRPNPEFPSIPPTLKEVQQAKDSAYQNAKFVCNKMGEASHPGKMRAARLNLEDTVFYDCDLSRVDWSDANLNRAEFRLVKLDGARLANVLQVDDTIWFETSWWTAAEIGAPLLKKLMKEYDPGSENEKCVIQKPTREEYVEHVKQLCRVANVSCPEESIKFTVPSSNC